MGLNIVCTGYKVNCLEAVGISLEVCYGFGVYVAVTGFLKHLENPCSRHNHIASPQDLRMYTA